VFAVHTDSEPRVTFAFDAEEAEQQEERWAAERDLSEALADARGVISNLPEGPTAEVAEIVKVADITRALLDLSTKDDVPAIGTPEFLQRAHDEKVFDSAILYQLLFI
jgi:hypothetical protein